MLTCRSLTATVWDSFGYKKHLYQNLNLTLQAGQCLKVIGANGSGKSTLLKQIALLLPTDYRFFFWKGDDLTVQARRQAYTKSLFYYTHQPLSRPDLRLCDNLQWFKSIYGFNTKLTDKALLQCVHLDYLDLKLPFKHLSQGEKKRLELCQLWLNQKELWLLDEPDSNLDTSSKAIITKKIEQHLQNRGIAVIATHQDLNLSSSQVQTLQI